MAIINIVKNLVKYDIIKHIGIDKYFIKEMIDSNEPYLFYTQAGDQLVSGFMDGPWMN